jgi:hypothetical protein
LRAGLIRRHIQAYTRSLIDEPKTCCSWSAEMFMFWPALTLESGLVRQTAFAKFVNHYFQAAILLQQQQGDLQE